jgi:hypothetical protein
MLEVLGAVTLGWLVWRLVRNVVLAAVMYVSAPDLFTGRFWLLVDEIRTMRREGRLWAGY